MAATQSVKKPTNPAHVAAGVVLLILFIAGCIAAGNGSGGSSAQAFCDDFRSQASGWIPETAGGSAAVNALPSDADLEHEAYELSLEAPSDLAGQMNTLVNAAGAHDAATFYGTADSIVTSCRTE